MIMKLIGKVKVYISDRRNDLFTAAVVALVGIIGFGAGRLTILLPKKSDFVIETSREGIVKVEDKKMQSDKASSTAATAKDTSVVASKRSKFYHYTWCPGAQKIKVENKLAFASAEEAEAKGLRLAGNCGAP